MSKEYVNLPPELVEGFFRLVSGDFSYRLPRSLKRDEQDTVAFFFNTIADELDRIIKTTQANEQRLTSAVEAISTALMQVAQGDLTVQVERNYNGDPLDVLSYLVNTTISELAEVLAENERRSAETQRRLEDLVRQRTSQLVDSEQNFRLLFDASPVPMLLLGMPQRIVLISNQAACNLLEIPLQSLQDRPLPDFFENDVGWSLVDASLDNNEIINAVTLQIKSGSGRLFWVMMNTQQVVYSGSQGVMITFVDLTRQKESENELQRLLEITQRQRDEIQALQAILLEHVIRDPLTELYNRRYLNETLEREFARALREAYPISFVMIDIDHFKNINDTFGHIAGDMILRSLAEKLLSQARVADIICRYGGEEFLAVLPNVTTEMTFQVAERWRKSFQESSVLLEDKETKATISCGIATFPMNGSTAEELISKADKALYHAKAMGRNRVVIWQNGLKGG